ncbi:hypothetical protein [Candidatus Uabimicrobium amorphum]|uniref:Uncharacterized protein n=1 Tax=Uabimicrobium amorphum TaxID=2596890 RepID=A0A5S9IKV6_UABAM|nr:hypothetical protein [Candidatus Uabimicrobium amorphum]BBM82920.1 hypothetical protein UABAM_01263 [Candidatus Uabimicrobium amorphum]
MKKLLLLLLFLTLVNADTLKQAVSASQVKKNVAKVMAVYDWSDSLEELQKEATKKNKMIFWLQVVGELDGGL